MARYNQHTESFLEQIQRGLTLFNPTVVSVEFDSEQGHFLRIIYAPQVHLTLRKKNPEGWTLDLFKKHDDGTIAQDFPQISRTLAITQHSEGSPGPSEVVDAFVDSFEGLLIEQSAIRGLYSEEVYSRFLGLVSRYRAERAPQIRARIEGQKNLEKYKQEQKNHENIFGFILVYSFVGIAIWILSSLF